MADDPPFEKKTEQLLVFLQNQVLELQRENLQHKATLTALEHYVLRLLHSESRSSRPLTRQTWSPKGFELMFPPL